MSRAGLVIPTWIWHAGSTQRAVSGLGWTIILRSTASINLILSGDGTMWRIVLRCLLELQMRSRPNADAYLHRLDQLVTKLTVERLKMKGDRQETASADKMVKGMGRESLSPFDFWELFSP